MTASSCSLTRKRRLLAESYSIIERLKRLRALNGNPRLVGINPRMASATNCLDAAAVDKNL